MLCMQPGQMLPLGVLKTKQRPALGGRPEGWKHNCIAESKGREAVERNYIMYIYAWTPTVPNSQAVML